MAEDRVQRRLAAIAVADVVGFSRLMQADEAGTLATLKVVRRTILEPIVRSLAGRIVKLMGDGVLMEFPSAVHSVQAALDLQARMAEYNRVLPENRRVLLRIGINLGDVIGEGSDIFGDGVNIAARLEAMAEPGGLCVSAKIHDEVRGKITAVFEDLGHCMLKNIESPIRVFRFLPDTKSRPPLDIVSKGARGKPSIAVLPFNNMSGDEEQEYFSDGITEDIITELSRFRNLSVIARNSSFAFKGQSANLQKVARELAVSYVLEGSIRRAGNRVRINAQLIEAEFGSHIWAERYDREILDVFAVQDEITRNIVGMLAVGLEEDGLERAKRKQPQNLIAYDHWLRGKRTFWTPGNDNFDARHHFERAVETDPGFSRGYSGLAVTYQMEALDFVSPADGKSAYEKAYMFAQKALSLDDADYQAHIALAWPSLYRGDYARMKKHVDRAVMLNPNDADSLANASYLLAMYGDAEQACDCGEAAIRLNPRHPDWYLAFLGTALFAARRYDEALAVRLRVADYYIDSTFIGAAVLAQLDRLAEAGVWAKRAVARLLATPGGSAQAARGCVQLLLENNPYRLQEDRDHFANAMRKAGVPG